jgi:hypothetical protein
MSAIRSKTDTPVRNLLVIIGFLLFILGMTSLVLDFVGVKIIVLAWLDYFGAIAAFGIKLLMAVVGITMAVGARTSAEEYDEFFDGKKSAQ